MKTIEAQIPEPVLKKARELAARERIPLEQIISLAVTQAVGVWSNESYMGLRAKRASREKFLDALKECPMSSQRTMTDCRKVTNRQTDPGANLQQARHHRAALFGLEVNGEADGLHPGALRGTRREAEHRIGVSASIMEIAYGI